MQALAVGNLSPGPNGLWTISLGYLSGGWLEAALSLLAITLPTLLILGVVALHRRVEDRPRSATSRGLSLGVVGSSSGSH